MTVSFSINLYDSEGVIYDEGIFLHFQEGGAQTIIKLKTIKELENVRDTLGRMVKEISEDYPGVSIR